MTWQAHNRVAVGLIWQETNSFNPLATETSDFITHEGDAVLSAYEATATALGGIIRRLRALGAVPIPTFAAKARPGGPIRDAVVEDLIARLIDRVKSEEIDAICLELHGGMASETVADVEGLLLSRLRKAIGRSVPISVALDLHGHITDRMVANVNFLTGYRTHPHSDMVETGERATEMLMNIVQRRVKLVSARRSVPFLALWRDETAEPPMRDVYQTLVTEAARHQHYIDASIFNTHPFLDAPGLGQVVVSYFDDDTPAAVSLTNAIADKLWSIRKEFVGEAPGLDEVFARADKAAREGSQPVAIGDQGDSVLAGTPGDSVEIARYAAKYYPALRGLIPVFDPQAVATARAAGIGTTVTLHLGASITPELVPLELTAIVVALTDGIFPNEGSYMKGVLNDMGATAILQAGAQTFIVTSRAPSACDPGLARHTGKALTNFQYIVVKSSNHFRLSLSPACDCIVAATPGLSSRKPDYLRHQKARPIFPVDEL
ncbi:M81 family metallopeptidase [Microvirga aerophila]|uniref:Microcystinase C n=1 Tax=Microvirga aerophila TaxID=670291 RepID=A0A512C1T1_9HYPH|nr:M81 family metallopeptidase [Microvirga aerophila]GEO18143.1 microcystinase C [Microvirga aerophila]